MLLFLYLLIFVAEVYTAQCFLHFYESPFGVGRDTNYSLTMNRIMMLFSALLMAFALSSCQGDAKDKTPSDPLVGLWESVFKITQVVTDKDQIVVTNTIILDLKEDKTFSYDQFTTSTLPLTTFESEKFSGTWSAVGDKITLKYVDPKSKENVSKSIKYEVESNYLDLHTYDPFSKWDYITFSRK